MFNILVTGSNGQLGTDISKLASKYTDYNFTFTDVAELDITNLPYLENYFLDHKFDFVINCAAYTAVDKAEQEKDLARLINTAAPSYLAMLCKKYNSFLIHVSTDYVFDGMSCIPYKESDITNAVSSYGKSKLDGELEVIENTNQAIIIRTSWLYSTVGSNFMKTMIRLGKEKEQLNVVFDQVGTPTYSADLAKAILDIIPNIKNVEKDKTEIYHFSNEGAISWYDFAKAIMEIANLKCKVNPIESKDFPTPTKRPNYSVFNKSKIKKDFNIEIPYWKDSLKVAIEEYLKMNN